MYASHSALVVCVLSYSRPRLTLGYGDVPSTHLTTTQVQKKDISQHY